MTAEKMWRMSGLEGEYEAWAFGGDADELMGIFKKTEEKKSLKTHNLGGCIVTRLQLSIFGLNKRGCTRVNSVY